MAETYRAKSFITIKSQGDEQSLHDLVITKRQWGAFHGIELDLQCRRRGVMTIVVVSTAPVGFLPTDSFSPKLAVRCLEISAYNVEA